MTVASEIQRIKDGIASSYTALEEKGATLPQNLTVDNLATTIASVPAGGGEAVDSDYKALLARLDATTSTANAGEWYKNAYYHSRELPYLHGVTSASNELWFKTSTVYKLLLPSGATIDTSNPVTFQSATWYKITFSGDRYVVSCKEYNDDGVQGIIGSFRTRPETYNVNAEGYQFNGYASKYLGTTSRSIVYSNASLLSSASVTQIKRYHVDNISFTDSSLSLDIISFVLRYHGGIEEALDLFPNISSLKVDPSVMGVYNTSIGYLGHSVLREDFPFILDYSSRTTSSYRGISNQIVNSAPSQGINLKIILPAMNWSWTGMQHLYFGDPYFCLTDEALKFMCENAPSVSSGITLTLNSYCNCVSYWPTFKAAMEAKGWTVSLAG